MTSNKIPPSGFSQPVEEPLYAKLQRWGITLISAGITLISIGVAIETVRGWLP